MSVVVSFIVVLAFVVLVAAAAGLAIYLTLKQVIDQQQIREAALIAEIDDLKQRLFHRANLPNPLQALPPKVEANKNTRQIVPASSVVRDLVHEDVTGIPAAKAPSRVPPKIRERFLQDAGAIPV